jgi:signal transduction histidine kinase
LIIRDNGSGFEPANTVKEPETTEHFGIRGMRERAAMLGSTCEIYSQPHEGNSIVIDFPANAQPHHAS